MANQDHNTPAEADERPVVNAVGAAEGKTGSANGAVGGSGADVASRGSGGASEGQERGEPGTEQEGGEAEQARQAGTEQQSGEAEQARQPGTEQQSGEAEQARQPGTEQERGTPDPARLGMGAPGHDSRRAHAVPYPPSRADAAQDPSGQPGPTGYPMPPQYGYAGRPFDNRRAPGRHRPSYEQPSYGYGPSYAEPGNAYPYRGPAYARSDSPYGEASSGYASHEQRGWEYDHPLAAQYGASAHQEVPPRVQQPEAPPNGYPGRPPQHGQAMGYGGLGDYPSIPPGEAHGPAEPLAPLPPRWADQQTRETADSLTPESLLPTRKPAPAAGWRRAVYRVTGGLIRPGESQAELRRRDLIYRVRTPVAGGHHRVAVMSLKGGVGKTTTVVGLGSMLASLRGDRVIAVDANPDRGTLSDKVRLETSATVRDLLNERAQVQRYADVRAFTSQAPSRLELLASDRDPAVSVAFSEQDYYDVAGVLEHYYSICITDCGTGLLHSAMAGVLQLADQIVLVSSPSVDGARSASATLDWLDAHDYGDLVRNAVVVLSIIRPRSKSTIDIDRLEQHFAARCRAVARIPYDPHLEEGAEVDLELLNPETADAYLVLAATVGDGFAWPRRVRVAVT